MVGDTESAWRWREMWTVEMETAWLLDRQRILLITKEACFLDSHKGPSVEGM